MFREVVTTSLHRPTSEFGSDSSSFRAAESCGADVTKLTTWIHILSRILQFFGGFFWGGGSWGGTLENLVIQNNTVEGTYGQAMVLWDNVVHGGNPAIIDHNTFVNVTLEPKFYRGGNNTLFTNNLFVDSLKSSSDKLLSLSSNTILSVSCAEVFSFCTNI